MKGLDPQKSKVIVYIRERQMLLSVKNCKKNRHKRVLKWLETFLGVQLITLEKHSVNNVLFFLRVSYSVVEVDVQCNRRALTKLPVLYKHFKVTEYMYMYM